MKTVRLEADTRGTAKLIELLDAGKFLRLSTELQLEVVERESDSVIATYPNRQDMPNFLQEHGIQGDVLKFPGCEAGLFGFHPDTNVDDLTVDDQEVRDAVIRRLTQPSN